MTAVVNAVVVELVTQSLMGDDIKGFEKVQNTNVRLQAFVVYGSQVVESKEELGLAAEARETDWSVVCCFIRGSTLEDGVHPLSLPLSRDFTSLQGLVEEISQEGG